MSISAARKKPADAHHADWLGAQIARLEQQLASHPVFDAPEAASPEELQELRAMIVIHTFLRQQLRESERHAFAGPAIAAAEPLDERIAIGR